MKKRYKFLFGYAALALVVSFGQGLCSKAHSAPPTHVIIDDRPQSDWSPAPTRIIPKQFRGEWAKKPADCGTIRSLKVDENGFDMPYSVSILSFIHAGTIPLKAGRFTVEQDFKPMLERMIVVYGSYRHKSGTWLVATGSLQDRDVLEWELSLDENDFSKLTISDTFLRRFEFSKCVK